MTAQLVLNFTNADDLARVLQLLRESGLEFLNLTAKPPRRRLAKPEKRQWAGIGSVNLGNALNEIHLRDFAYE